VSYPTPLAESQRRLKPRDGHEAATDAGIKAHLATDSDIDITEINKQQRQLAHPAVYLTW
jgi:hypothetical protein